MWPSLLRRDSSATPKALGALLATALSGMLIAAPAASAAPSEPSWSLPVAPQLNEQYFGTYDAPSIGGGGQAFSLWDVVETADGKFVGTAGPPGPFYDADVTGKVRSEERRVGKECRSR